MPEKVLNMKPYDPTEDIYRIKLDANESPFDPPAALKQKIERAVSSAAFNRYPDPKCGDLRSKAAAFFGVTQNQVVAGNGSDELIALILGSLCKKGARLMLLAPDFSMYGIYAGLNELEVFTVCKGSDMKISVDRIIEEAKKIRPDLIMFSNPCNPTGQGIGKSEMLRLASNSDALMIIDEAYMDFFNESVLPDAANLDNVIVLRTASKAFGFASIRLGFAVGNEYLISQLQKSRSPFNVNAMTQAAAGVILSEPEYLKDCAKKIISLKNELEDMLIGIFCDYPELICLIKTVTNFTVVKTDFAGRIYSELLKRSICVRRFDGFLRITAGKEQENRELVKSLADILKSLED
ncbi:MAG: histidinol-phosphate transaminase [Bacillota bacterium]|nr:histidinol-phosphate transaminase [Bacillota bacterium]